MCALVTGVQTCALPIFFSRYFGTVQVGAGAAFVTGYFEPEIAASRTRQPGYDVPVYRRPADLVDVDLGLFSDALKGKNIRGRRSEERRVGKEGVRTCRSRWSPVH